VAREAPVPTPGVVDRGTERFGAPTAVRHAEGKAAGAGARLFVRTGEATPYANVILRCGVPF